MNRARFGVRFAGLVMLLSVPGFPVTVALEQTADQRTEVGRLDDVSYALGTQLAANARQLFRGLTLNAPAFIDALRDTLTNQPPQYSTSVMSEVLRRLSEKEKISEDDIVKTSYAVGIYLGQQIAIYRNEVEVESFVRGVSDPLSGQPLAVSEEDIERLLREFVEQRKRERARSLATNKERNKRFFTAVREKDDVKELRGIFYESVRAGDGDRPREDDQVIVHYTGTLIDGTEFDSSRARGEPAVFSPREVIRGWRIALSHMRVGDRWKLYIPPDLAYGDNGSPPAISPGAALIFDVELLGIR